LNPYKDEYTKIVLEKENKREQTLKKKNQQLTSHNSKKECQKSFLKFQDLIENLASNESKNKGEDIADSLVPMDWKDFRFFFNE